MTQWMDELMDGWVDHWLDKWDCLAILGLNLGATEREIKRVYFTKARELHPDRSLLPRDKATARFQSNTE